MRKLLTILSKAFLLLSIVMAATMVNAQARYAPLVQNDFTISVLNLTQPTDKTIEFDVYMLDTDGSQPFELSGVTLGFLINSNIYFGGSLAVTYSNVGSGLLSIQQFSSTPSVSTIGVPAGQTSIKLAGKSPPGPGNGTIISSTSPGTLLTHFILTNTISWAINSLPSLTFNASTAPPAYGRTLVGQYIGLTNTAMSVIPGTNAFVCCNPALNVPLTASWTGATDNDWTKASNWDTGVPADITAVTIPGAGITNFPILTTAASCASITIESGGSFIGAENLTVSGASTMKRNISLHQWHFISSPVSGAVSEMFLHDYLQEHREPTNDYADIYSTGVSLEAVKGYALWVDEQGTSPVIFTGGTFNSGTQTFNTSYSGSGNNFGWNLVGNPYQSSIDWDEAGMTKTNLDNAIYVENNSGWASYVGGVGDNGGTQYIAPCQGFFVKANAPGGSLTMTNSVRTNNPTTFFKNSNDYIANLVRIQVSGNSYNDEAVVRFLPEATAEFDGAYDAHKLYGNVAEAPQIYTMGSTPLAINTLPETNLVPLGIHAGMSGTYSIAATEINDISAVSLEDVKLGTFNDLTKGPYTFDFTAGENEQRFILHFNSLGVNNTETSSANIYALHKTVYIDLTGLSNGNAFIYNVAGQLITTAQLAKGMNKVSLPATGIYMVKVLTGQTSLVKKIWIEQ